MANKWSVCVQLLNYYSPSAVFLFHTLYSYCSTVQSQVLYHYIYFVTVVTSYFADKYLFQTDDQPVKYSMWKLWLNISN